MNQIEHTDSVSERLLIFGGTVAFLTIGLGMLMTLLVSALLQMGF